MLVPVQPGVDVGYGVPPAAVTVVHEHEAGQGLGGGGHGDAVGLVLAWGRGGRWAVVNKAHECSKYVPCLARNEAAIPPSSRPRRTLL